MFLCDPGSLDGWWCDLHSEDDVANLTLGERSHVDVVLLSSAKS